MAPEFVLDYVVAHEVAHTVEHNHGKDFWKVTEGFVWGYGKGESLVKRLWRIITSLSLIKFKV